MELQDANGPDVEVPSTVEELFTKADNLLLKHLKFKEAEKMYRRILELDSNNIDAITSLAYCLKFEAASSDKSLSMDLYE